MKKKKINKKLLEKINFFENLFKNMTIPEKRLFTIYLSRMTTKGKSAGTVKFSLAEFRRIMDIKQEISDIRHFRKLINKILNKIIVIPDENNCNRIVHPLCACAISRDKHNQLFFEFTADKNILPFFSAFREYYFKNHLWNCFFLKSENQVRMYRIMRQYIEIGIFETDIENLKKLLGLRPEEYKRTDGFRKSVIDSCQKFLSENTDICYTYREGCSDVNGRWTSIVFYIRENENCPDLLHLKEFI